MNCIRVEGTEYMFCEIEEEQKAKRISGKGPSRSKMDMGNEQLTKRVLEGQFTGTSSRGIPRTHWRDYVEENAREFLDVRN